MLAQMKSWMRIIEERLSRSPSVSPKSSNSSSSSSPCPGGADGGDQGGGGGSSVDSSTSTHVLDPYKLEKKCMRIKGYDTLKFPSIPKNAAEARGFWKSIYSVACKLAKKDESKVFAWLSQCNDASSSEELAQGEFPILDRVIGHKLIEMSRGTRFSLDFQTVQESFQRKGKQP